MQFFIEFLVVQTKGSLDLQKVWIEKALLDLQVGLALDKESTVLAAIWANMYKLCSNQSNWTLNYKIVAMPIFFPNKYKGGYLYSLI